jgi:hypothetical protein
MPKGKLSASVFTPNRRVIWLTANPHFIAHWRISQITGKNGIGEDAYIVDAQHEKSSIVL